MNSLVVYFSASGVTAEVAKHLAEAIDAPLYEIRPKIPYTPADLDWTNKNSRSINRQAVHRLMTLGIKTIPRILFAYRYDSFRVPFVGIVNWFISLPSSSRRAFFRMIPPPYPVRLPADPTTRWQGTMMQIGL